MKGSIKFLKGYIFITTQASLDEIARKISATLSINLEKAPVGRFEEYVGYECDVMGLNITLLGEDPTKPPVKSHTYELSIGPSSKIIKPGMTFEEVDISNFLEMALGQISDVEISI